MSEDNRTINPDAEKVQVGIKTLREITIYPLSISDQMKLTDKFSEAIEQFSQFDRENMSNEDAINFIKNFLSQNLPEFMEFVVDPDETTVPTLDEVTNKQLGIIADVVFRINYEELIKNAKDLFKRVKEAMGTQDQ